MVFNIDFWKKREKRKQELRQKYNERMASRPRKPRKKDANTTYSTKGGVLRVRRKVRNFFVYSFPASGSE